MSSFWYSTYYLKQYICWTKSTGIFLSSLRHACSCSTPKWFTHSQRVDAHIPSPNSLPTHRQAHTSHVQWSLETCSSVCPCVCVCVVRYLHQDGWKHTVWQNHMNPRGTLPERKEEIMVGTHNRWTTTLKMEDTGDKRCSFRFNLS